MGSEYKGAKYELRRSEPGYWRWKIEIDGRINRGLIRANLKLLAERRLYMKIDAELREIIRRKLLD